MIFAVLSLIFAFIPNNKTQISLGLFLVIVLLILFINFIFIFVDFKKYKSKAFLPFIILLIIIVLVIRLNGYVFIKLREIEFNKNYKSYQEIVQLIKEDKIKYANSNPIKLPEKYEHLAYSTFVFKHTNGEFYIEFFTGGGFPVRHFGYFYCSDDTKFYPKNIKERWPHLKKIKKNWFYMSD
jgi:energy-coupling factor transporter transmembrane protein EcfT